MTGRLRRFVSPQPVETALFSLTGLTILCFINRFSRPRAACRHPCKRSFRRAAMASGVVRAGKAAMNFPSGPIQ